VDGLFVLYLASVAFGYGWISDTKFQKFSDKDWIWIFKKRFGYGSGVKKSISAHLWRIWMSRFEMPFARFELTFWEITGNVCTVLYRTVLCVVSSNQAQHLQTGLRLRDRNTTMASKKWKDSYDIGRKYRSDYKRLVKKASDGSVCKLWHHCAQSVQSYKPCKVREASVMSSSTRTSET